MSNKTSVVSSDKFTNVRNFYVNGKRYSACDWWQYSEENQTFVFSGELFCCGWYKKGETIYQKCQAERNG